MLMNKILVIEDDARIQKALHRLFAGEGYEVTSATDGDAALDAFLTLSFSTSSCRAFPGVISARQSSALLQKLRSWC